MTRVCLQMLEREVTACLAKQTGCRAKLVCAQGPQERLGVGRGVADRADQEVARDVVAAEDVVDRVLEEDRAADHGSAHGRRRAVDDPLD